MIKTNICFLLGSYGTGGAENHVLQIVRNLDPDKFNISLVIYQPIGENRDAFQKLDINIFELPVYKNKFVNHFLKLFNIIHVTLFLLRSKIDVVHIHLVGIYLVSMFASIFAGLNNRIITWHNVYDSTVIKWRFKSIWPNLKFLFRVKFTSLLSNSIIAVSHKVADSNTKYFRISRKKVHTVHNGIKHSDQTRIVVEKFKILKLIAVGSLTKQKGYFIMLQAIKKTLNIKSVNILLDIYGEGSLFNDIENEIKKMKLSDYIHLKAAREAMHYRQSILETNESEEYESMGREELENEISRLNTRED